MLAADLPDNVLVPHICGIDTETNGLDFRASTVLLFQYSSELGTFTVPVRDELPTNVRKLLANNLITKVIHFAEFDLCMLRYNFNIAFSSVRCTKIAAKIIDSTHKLSHSLKNLLNVFLDIQIMKLEDIRMGDWNAEITAEMLDYAEDDVRYLVPLYEKMLSEITDLGKRDEYFTACECLPLLIELKTQRYDVMQYMRY